ncbi:MAG TPA: phosphoribosylformylglycinamidine synthase subunit PurL [Actinomycetota bacterium]|jgi:phosphoribosylformylglycinamidine synthase|nr:phosphoribosylformylglycinamidine synthase subunit PurL [Actinomycetota bacterium]
MDQPLHRALGLTDAELDAIRRAIGREPNRNELAMYAVMWSEHCSYKSSKVHLRRLPTQGPRILVGPGQDAGAVDLGEGLAVVFKMESHSHPSAIEPYQGAATGVGGIVRDIISMGARPIALLDPLRFGPLSDARNRFLLGGVVAGIGGYGNCIGVPTVGGEVRFAPAHAANPTVNVMCVGIAPADRLVTSAREIPAGSLLLLFGAATGRDGIGGVSVLASQTLEEGAEEGRPSVQIGDPFAGKLLIEASLELVERDLLEGLQDLGGAGLTCAVSESAARARLGADLNLDAVPLREGDLEPFEILTSESQERMLAIVHPDRMAEARSVCDKWGLASAVVGGLRQGGGLSVTIGGRVVAEVPARSLADEGPEYHRPMEPPAEVAEALEDDPTFATIPVTAEDALRSVLASPNVASKRWIWEQYDSIVQGRTVLGPGADAAVIRIDGSLRALVLASDGNGRYGALDPYLGAAHAVAEAARNVATVGATPLAVTNCLNFGNPERPEVMWQFAEAIQGMADACRALQTPVTGGNVSFYNESGGSAIWPTPVIGMVGLIEDYRLLVRPGFRSGTIVYLLGETLPELGGSEFAEVVLGTVSGHPPALDLEVEAALQRLLVKAASQDLLVSAHDCSDGGLAVTLAGSALAGDTGFAVSLPGDVPWYVTLFSESASRAVVSVRAERARELEDLAGALQVPFQRLGETGGPRLVVDGRIDLALEEARRISEGTIPDLMQA